MRKIPPVAWLSVVLMIVSLAVAVLARHRQDREPGWVTFAWLLTGAWALLPPIWFIWEWHRFDPSSGRFEEFKHGQDLARNVWVALVIVLATIMRVHWAKYN